MTYCEHCGLNILVILMYCLRFEDDMKMSCYSRFFCIFLYLYLYLLLQPLKLGQVDLLAVYRPSNKYARIQTITTVFPVFVYLPLKLQWWRGYHFVRTHDLKDHISASRGCCALKFLHTLESDLVLLAHISPGMGVLLIIFYIGVKKLV